jgi:hypothetical protein
MFLGALERGFFATSSAVLQAKYGAKAWPMTGEGEEEEDPLENVGEDRSALLSNDLVLVALWPFNRPTQRAVSASDISSAKLTFSFL